LEFSDLKSHHGQLCPPSEGRAVVGIGEDGLQRPAQLVGRRLQKIGKPT